MKKIVKRKSSSDSSSHSVPKDKLNIEDLIYKVQQQLVFLEKKIDTLIAQSSQKPAETKSFSKPFQRFDRPHYNEGRRDHNFRERNFFQVICADCKKECEIPFKPSGDRPVYCKDCFSKRNDGGGGSFQERHDSRPRGEDFPRGRHFEKHQHQRGGDERRPGRRKKSAF